MKTTLNQTSGFGKIAVAERLKRQVELDSRKTDKLYDNLRHKGQINFYGQYNITRISFMQVRKAFLHS